MTTKPEAGTVHPGAGSATRASLLRNMAAGLTARKRVMNFQQWLLQNSYDASQLSPTQEKHLTAAWRAELPVADLPGGQSRDDVIHSLVAQYQASNERSPEKRQSLQAIGERAIAEGWDISRTKLELLRADRTIGPMCLTPRDNGDSSSDVLACSLACSMGASESSMGKAFGERVANIAFSKQHRGASFHSVMRSILAAHGEHVPPGRFSDRDVRRVFEVSRQNRDMYSLDPSTYDLTGILSNAANKAALASFEGVPATWRKFCKIGDLADFKTATLYRLTGSGQFEQVAPGGNIKHGSLTEASATIKADTYGKLIAIDRRDLINDDLQMFAAIPRLLGRMGAIGLEKAVFSLLISNTGSFFHTDNKNISTGSPGSVLSLVGLDAAHKLFLQQLDDNGDPAMIVPQVLLVPPALDTTARTLTASATIISGTATASQPNANAFGGMFEPVSSPWLADSTDLHGNSSDTAWYLLTGPNDYSVIQVGFVGGNQFPTIEQGELDFEKLGVAFRSYYDWGVAFLEPRGGVLSAGA